MTEINKIGINTSTPRPAGESVQQTEVETLNIFGDNTSAQNKDIGDIHGSTSYHKKGNINGKNFDVETSILGNVSGTVNGNEVKISKTPGIKPSYKGNIGNTKVSFTSSPKMLPSDRNYKGQYGDKSFDINYRDVLTDNKLSGQFDGKKFEIKIDKNAFSADDIVINSDIPKELEEFFPVLYTIANREKVQRDETNTIILLDE